jgi:hypothetical protein
LESVSKKVMSPNPKQIYWVKVTRQQNNPEMERFGVGDKEKIPVKNGSHLSHMCPCPSRTTIFHFVMLNL